MKVKKGFVSNSSSTAFIITNHTKEPKNLVDFVAENPQLIEDFKQMYGYTEDSRFTQDNLLMSAAENNVIFAPGKNRAIFGDEDNTLIGEVFDYILRDGGSSKSFSWRFYEYLR